MKQWVHIAMVVASLGFILTLLFVFIWRWVYHKQPHKTFVEPDSLHKKPQIFKWSDHPALAVDAVENGWSQFAFTGLNSYMSSPSKPRGVMGVKGVCGCGLEDHGREIPECEISWEVCEGSSDFMQKVRLKPCGIKRDDFDDSYSVIRTALPLPGPPLGNCSFPQEAYFEITVLCVGSDNGYEEDGKNIGEGDKIKLIQEHNSNGKGISKMEGDGNQRKGGNREGMMFSVGLTAGGCVPLRFPGSYSGSIGFNSNGSVFLDGNSPSL